MKLILVGDRFIAQLDEDDMKEIEKKTSGINRPFPFRTVRKSFGGGKPPQASEPRQISMYNNIPVPPKSIIDIGEDTSINPSKPQPEEPATLICGTCCLEVCNYKENGNSIINWIKRRLKK